MKTTIKINLTSWLATRYRGRFVMQSISSADKHLSSHSSPQKTAWYFGNIINFGVLILAALVCSSCIPIPYFGSRQEQNPVITQGSAKVKMVWRVPVFCPANILSFLTEDKNRQLSENRPNLFPVIWNNYLLIPAEGEIKFLDKFTGKEMQHLKTPLKLGNLRKLRLAVSGNVLFVYPNLRAFDLETGDMLWQAKNGFTKIQCLYPINENKLLVQDIAFIYLIDAISGEKLWKLKETQSIISSVQTAGKVIMFSLFENERKQWITNAFSIETGRFLWTIPGKITAVYDGKLAAGPAEKQIKFYDSVSGKFMFSVDAPDAHPHFSCLWFQNKTSVVIDTKSQTKENVRGFTVEKKPWEGWLVFAGEKDKKKSGRETFHTLYGASSSDASAWMQKLETHCYFDPVKRDSAVILRTGAPKWGTADIGTLFSGISARDYKSGQILFNIEFASGFLNLACEKNVLWIWARDGWIYAYKWEL